MSTEVFTTATTTFLDGCCTQWTVHYYTAIVHCACIDLTNISTARNSLTMKKKQKVRKPLTESGKGVIKPEKKSETEKTFDREWEKTNEIRKRKWKLRKALTETNEIRKCQQQNLRLSKSVLPGTPRLQIISSSQNEKKYAGIEANKCQLVAIEGQQMRLLMPILLSWVDAELLMIEFRCLDE